MFDTKQESLFVKQKEAANQFIEKGLKATSETRSGNGALKYNTTGNPFVDNFAAISYFKEPRSYEEIDRDMNLLWSIDPKSCLKLSVYIRLITRKTKVAFGENKDEFKAQRGQGMKHEGIMRMIWLAVNQPATFKANIAYFIAAGSWKDIFQMLSYDLQYNGWNNRKLDWNFMYMVILTGLTNKETTHLVRKYLPTIRTNKHCTTIESQADTLIGRWFANKFYKSVEMKEVDKYTNYKAYRKMKSSGIAHDWQQKISKQLYDSINFDTIAGRALTQLVDSKFLENHNLVEKYTNWISSKPVAKYTGFVFELFKPFGMTSKCSHLPRHQESTINAQFNGLVQTAKEGVNPNSGLIVVRDTSSSMWSLARGCNMSSYAIGKAMALYFSEFLKGPFANSFIEFANTCALHKWQGNTPCEKWVNDKCEAYGGTNFQSVIDLFIRLKNEGVDESDFPTGLLLVSDGEFDNCGTNRTTNFTLAIQKFRDAGFSDSYVDNFKIILWDIPNNFYGFRNGVKFEEFANYPNFFYMSGYDPASISFLLPGTQATTKAPKNANELFEAAMDQALLNSLKVVSVNKKKYGKQKRKR